MTATPHPRFGLFDHLDRSETPVHQLFYDRLRIIEAADALGYHCYHLAEHHGTPLGLAPSPGVMLAAVTQRTRRIRLCPLIYPLPMYNPLRLVEEIGMLDQLSMGRIEVGVGRGGSPHELAYYGVDPEKAKAIFSEALQIVRMGLETGRVDIEGTFHSFRQVPIEVPVYQKPFPPFWYGASTHDSIAWVARERMNMVAGGSLSKLRAATDLYREIQAQTHGTSIPGDLRLGAVRRLVVAETDEEALRIARPAYAVWYGSMIKLWRDFGAEPSRFFPDLESAIEHDVAIVGSPRTVAEGVANYFEKSGCNYFIGAVAFGSLDVEHSLQTLGLFRSEVMPRFPADALGGSPCVT